MTYHLLVVLFNRTLYGASELRMGVPEQIQMIWYDMIVRWPNNPLPDSPI